MSFDRDDGHEGPYDDPPPAGSEAEDLVGDGAAMARLRRDIAAAAPLSSTVLVLGETGVGKGVVARSLHRLSPRRDAPFVHVDCAALSSQVVESELFGHERGAFTSAHARRVGRFELAAAGTLFLDEIGDLEARLQAKLLRVLQDRRFERLGGNRTLQMRARIVAATARNLRSDVAAGRFRADLYYRLAVIPIAVPPLRARREDIPALLRAAAKRSDAPYACVWTEPALARMSDYAWPGNIRELQNVAERVALQSRDRPIDAAGLDGFLEDEQPIRSDAFRTDDPAEIISALRDSDGNISQAARRLGIPRTTLRHRIRRLGIE